MNTQKTVRRFLGLLCLSGVCAMAAGNPTSTKGPTNSQKAIATLTQIQETRRIDVAKKADVNKFDFNTPRLELTFDITPPNNKQIANIDQPTTIKATDSVGADLTAVKANYLNRKEFVQLISTWNEPPTKLTVKLAPPARSATRFSLSAQFAVWAYEKTKETTFTPGTEGTQLDTALFNGEMVSARLQQTSGGLYLTITPGSIKNRIESVELMDGNTKLDSQGTMWNEDAINYMFQGTIKPSLKAKIKIRIGMQSYPCTIDIKDNLLP